MSVGVGSTSEQGVAVHKFGGSSLANQARIQNVAGIIAQYTKPNDFVVVSANGDVTDWLVAVNEGNVQILDHIADFYHSLAAKTLKEPKGFLAFFEQTLRALKTVTHRAASQAREDAILSFGELWSADLLVCHLQERGTPAIAIDAREIFRTDAIDDFRAFDQAYFDDALASARFSAPEGARLVVTGFIANNGENQTITLGRNGSDYSASLLARFSGASRVTLWTDVPGIYTADPRLVNAAHPIPLLSYNEAMSLAAVGTNVLHQKTINPLIDHAIPLFVRSSLKPNLPGTQVSQQGDVAALVKSLALKSDLVKMTVLPSKKDKAFTLQDIQHHLFESHISTIAVVIDEMHTQESTSNRHETQEQRAKTILVNADLVSKACQRLEALGLTVTIAQARSAVIAIVGENIGFQREFAVQLGNSLKPSVKVSIIDPTQQHVLFLETPSAEAANVLEHVYASSFDLAAYENDTSSTEAVY